SEVPRHAVLDLLSSLVDRSFIVFDSEGTALPYRMLDTIRLYAASRLEASGNRPVFRTRHLDYFVETVTTADHDLLGPWQAAWLARLEPEQGNLRAAFEWALSQPGCGDSALSLAN